MKNILLALALLWPAALFAQVATAPLGVAAYFTPASQPPDSGNIGLWVDRAGTIITSDDVEPYGLIIGIEGSQYQVAVQGVYGGAWPAQYESTHNITSSTINLILGPNGKMMAQPEFGPYIRVATLWEFTSGNLSVVPVDTDYGMLDPGVTMDRSLQHGQQDSTTISDWNPAVEAVVTPMITSSLASYNPAWTNITGKPAFGTAALQNTSAFAAASHSHVIADVTNLQSTLNGKQATLATPTAPLALNTGTSTLSISAATPSAAGTMSAADKNKLDGLSAPVARSFAIPSRSLNSAFQIDASRDSFVSYSVKVTATMSLLAGQVGTVYLEYADDSGFTTNVVTLPPAENGNTGTLVVGVTLSQSFTATLTGMIPGGKYVRLRTQNNTGTPTFTFTGSQEVKL